MATLTAQVKGRTISAAAELRGRLSARAVPVLDRARLALWIPVLFGAGIGAYFALPVEPEIWSAVVSLILFLGTAIVFRRGRRTMYILGLAGALVAAGFAAAQIRNAFVAAPVLAKETGPVRVSARVLNVQPTDRGLRLTLDRVSIPRIAASATPARVRITVRSLKIQPLPGDRISALAILQPPPAPSYPGGFDFARKAWFERIGGVGFALGAVSVVEHGNGAGWHIRLARLRLNLTKRILAASSERLGPVAAALLTGERRAIPKESLAAMRDSGLAHLLAISGLHIGLVAGLLFFAVRLGLALIEPVALRYPIKKYAAAAAIAGALAYLLISGATIPTQRAFLMVSIVMFAVMIDRTAISMRLVAVSAIAVLLLAPESLLSASFQMSFAAVIGLVAVYEATASSFTRLRQRGGIMGSRLGLFIVATILTTLVASTATAPFAIYHFNRIALYGLAANLFAVPVMAMWIMPFGLLGFLLMPFGLEAIGLVPMGWGIGLVLWIAESISALPGSVAMITPMTTSGLTVVALGGLWLCLNRAAIRFLGVPVVAVGLASAALVAKPDLLLSQDGKLAAIVLEKDDVAMSPGKGRNFERDMWKRRLAVAEAPAWDLSGVSRRGQAGCDGLGCVFHIGGKSIALVNDPQAAFEDCGRVDHVILLARVPRRLCRGGDIAVSTFHIWRDGAHTVRFTPDGPVVQSSREARGDRPWSRISDRKRQYLRTRPTSRP